MSIPKQNQGKSQESPLHSVRHEQWPRGTVGGIVGKSLRVLVACEESGVVRDAFNARGHDAWSCDLLERPGKHICDDVLLHLEDGWDLMIAHPPCTYLSVSGLHWNKKRPEREKLTNDAMIFVLNLIGEGFVDNPIPKIALENPVSCISTRYRKPDQIIQPWQFGHPESKATCLWLKNLPQLIPTNILPLPGSGRWENQTPSGQNKLGPSPERAMLRSKTYQGIADAMAEQWGGTMEENKICPICGYIYQPTDKWCMDCGYDYVDPEESIKGATLSSCALDA